MGVFDKFRRLFWRTTVDVSEVKIIPATAETLVSVTVDSSLPIGSDAQLRSDESSEEIWNRMVHSDRAAKEQLYGKSLEAPGLMPDTYYARELHEGEFNRAGTSVYLDRSNLTPPPSLEGETAKWDGVMRLGQIGLWCSGTTRCAIVIAILDNGKSIYIIREYGSALIRLTLQRDGQFKEPGTKNYFLPGEVGSNYLMLKRWWTREELGRPRFPNDLAAVAKDVEKLENRRVYCLPSNIKKREIERTHQKQIALAKREALIAAKQTAEIAKEVRKAKRAQSAAEAKRRRDNPTEADLEARRTYEREKKRRSRARKRILAS